MKKKLLFAIVLGAMLQCGTIAYAGTPNENISTVENMLITPRAEVKEWKTRVVNGQLQKRQWSVTYEHWIGEWIDVN